MQERFYGQKIAEHGFLENHGRGLKEPFKPLQI